MKSTVATALTSYSATDLNVSYPSTPTYTGAGETDIVYQVGALSGSSTLAGVTWCDDPVDGSDYACDQQYVRFKTGATVNVALACHETGHAVGLVHGEFANPATSNTNAAIGCMITPYIPSATSPGSENVQNINGAY